MFKLSRAVCSAVGLLVVSLSVTRAASAQSLKPTLLGVGEDIVLVSESSRVHRFGLDGRHLGSEQCDIRPLHWTEAPDGSFGQRVTFDSQAREFVGVGLSGTSERVVFAWSAAEPCPRTEMVLRPAQGWPWFVGARESDGARLVAALVEDGGQEVYRIPGGASAPIQSGALVPHRGDPSLMGIVSSPSGEHSLLYLPQIEKSAIPEVVEGPYLFCSLSGHACFYSSDEGITWLKRGPLPRTTPPARREVSRLRFNPWDDMWYAFVEVNDEGRTRWIEGWRSSDGGSTWQPLLGRNETMQENGLKKYFAGPFFNQQGVWIQLSDDEDFRGEDCVVRVLNFPADGGEPRWVTFEAPAHPEGSDPGRSQAIE